MQKKISLTVNGQLRSLAVDIRESLADLLRYELGLTSVKKGCEMGECGACTVLLNGQAVNSCIYLALWANGKKVLTVEGLTGPYGELNPVQQAFMEQAASQCDFCTPGPILTAVQLLGKAKSYSREDLRREISGNLCRCTGYENILSAIEKALQLANT